MGSDNRLLVVVSVLFPVLLVCTSLPADEKNAEESKRVNWGWAHNEGNVDVLLHVKIGRDRYTDLILPAGGKMILPEGAVKVKVVPMKFNLEQIDKLEVDIRPSYHSPFVSWPRITEPGTSRTFLEPTTAIPIKDKSYLDADVIVPPGASEPEPEGALPSGWELPRESKKRASLERKREPEQASSVDRESRLRELNELYTKYSKRLAEVGPGSEEARWLRKALREHGRLIDKYIAEEVAEHGPNWIERYRDAQTGKLPGGLLEDSKSKLVKLKEDRKKQKEQQAELEKDFERLKKAKPVPSWKEYLNSQRDKLREEFVKKYGDSSQWDEDERADYRRKYNELGDKVREDWEKAREAEAENNRKLGRIIKRLAIERSKLKELQEEIRQLEKEVPKELSALDGVWRGNDFTWGNVTINNGRGTSSYGHFEVQRRKLVIYYDFKPFSQSIHKNNRRYHREYEYSGEFMLSGGWFGVIGFHVYNENVLHVVYEVYPGDTWSTENFTRVSSPSIKKDSPKKEQK